MPLKTVFDSNLYVAAALRPGQYADRWLDIAMLPGSGLQLYVSPFILREVELKLIGRFGFGQLAVRQFVERIRHSATVVKPPEPMPVVLADPDDDNIIACALAANAQLIVTADSHLLQCNPYQGIGIAHPRELKRIFAEDYRG